MERISTQPETWPRATEELLPRTLFKLAKQFPNRHYAEYFTDPYTAPWRPRATIVAQWLKHRDRPGETTFSWDPLVVGSELNIITGRTTYPKQTYSNLWVIRLDPERRCSHFTEWWMLRPKEAT